MSFIPRARWVKIGVPVAVVVAGLGAVQLIGAESASAAVAPVIVSATSANDTSLQKTITFRCPPGRVAVGVTATSSRPWGVHIIGLVPNGSTATATARVFSGAGLNWSMWGTASCASRPADVQYVSTTSTTPVNPGSATVGARTFCPGGKRLIGFGGTVTGGHIVSFMPQGNPATGIWLSGGPFAGTVGALTVRSVAVCATGNFTTQYREEPLTESQGGPVRSAGSCPAGSYAHAAAGWVASGSGAGDSYFSDVTVNGTATRISVTLRSSTNSPFSGKVVPFCVQ